MEKFWDMSFDAIVNVIVALIILAAGFFATKLIVHLFGKGMKKTHVDASLVNFFKRCIRILCYLLILISALAQLGISTTGIIASFSALAVAFGLALKDSLSDIASGVIILFTRPFVTGDFIEFDNHKGFVERIDLMHTYLRTYDDTNVVIPNSNITTTKVTNYTTNPEIRVQVFVPIPYEADFDKVKTIILKTVKGAEHVILDIPKFEPKVRLDKYNDSSLDVSVRCWTSFEHYWDVYFYLTENIKKDLEKEDILIPFNQLDVHIINNE